MLALQELVRIRSRPIIVSWYEFHVSSNKLQASRQSAKSIRHGYYEVLGISPTSRQSDIKRAYLEIVKKHHPDRAGSDNTESKTIFAEASEAYQCLTDPTQRHLYDAYGFPSSQMKNEGESNIDEEFQRKYSAYNQRNWQDIRHPEDPDEKDRQEWFKARGHPDGSSNGWRSWLRSRRLEAQYEWERDGKGKDIKESLIFNLKGILVMVVVLTGCKFAIEAYVKVFPGPGLPKEEEGYRENPFRSLEKRMWSKQEFEYNERR